TMSSNSMPDKTDRRLSLCPTTAQFSASSDQSHSPLDQRRDSPAEREDEHSAPSDPDVDAPRQPVPADETRRGNERQTDPRAHPLTITFITTAEAVPATRNGCRVAAKDRCCQFVSTA